jgi:hypothetical protein
MSRGAPCSVVTTPQRPCSGRQSTAEPEPTGDDPATEQNRKTSTHFGPRSDIDREGPRRCSDRPMSDCRPPLPGDDAPPAGGRDPRSWAAIRPVDGAPRSSKVPHMPARGHVSMELFVVLWLVVVPAALLLTAVLWGRRGSPPGRSDPGSDDGRGRGPELPRTPPDAPRGGIPLPDAEPSRARIRDHGRLADRVPARQRRSTRDPERRPARTSHGQ